MNKKVRKKKRIVPLKRIHVKGLWRLIHTLPMYRKFQTYAAGKITEAYAHCINLPCSVNFREEEIRLVIANIKDFLKEPCRGKRDSR
jgi:dTDP-4-amino-4,6-dideoxygalactose transaminase